MEYLAYTGATVLIWFVLVLLFTPGISYQLRTQLDHSSEAFIQLLEANCPSKGCGDNRVTVLRDGERFYPAMLEAIRGAKRSVNLESYDFKPGVVADWFIEALSDRARGGVIVTVVIDAFGSWTLTRVIERRLRAAGVRVHRYRSLKWYEVVRYNNRTHREILVIDGRVAFMGGAGIADWWGKPEGGRPPWRDTMIRLDGPVVGQIQGVFAENYLECCGEILSGEEFYPPLGPAGSTEAFVIKSSPADRATTARLVTQMLIECARTSVCINTPYFLPDRALRRALCAAARRGVAVGIVVPGDPMDQRWVRLASRRNYGQLLRAGVRIHEYQRSMMHAKLLLVDDLWALLGTTNLDNRSFEHNDEVNIAMRGTEVVAPLKEGFAEDLTLSDEMTLDEWRRRSWLERVVSPVVWLFERQQ